MIWVVWKGRFWKMFYTYKDLIEQLEFTQKHKKWTVD